MGLGKTILRMRKLKSFELILLRIQWRGCDGIWSLHLFFFPSKLSTIISKRLDSKMATAAPASVASAMGRLDLSPGASPMEDDGDQAEGAMEEEAVAVPSNLSTSEGA